MAQLTDLEAGFDSNHVIAMIIEELARRHMSRQALADAAKISISTLEKTLSGHRRLTVSTVVRIEEALGKSLRQQHSDATVQPTSPVTAPDQLGGYSRKTMSWLEGRYLTLRPSFSVKTAILAYITDIQWEPDKGHLVFSESERVDNWFEQRGFVSASNISGHIYLVTTEDGQYRTVTLGRAAKYNALVGILSSLAVAHGTQGVPVASPVVLLKHDADHVPDLGKIEPGDALYSRYRELLDIVIADEFALFPR